MTKVELEKKKPVKPGARVEPEELYQSLLAKERKQSFERVVIKKNSESNINMNYMEDFLTNADEEKLKEINGNSEVVFIQLDKDPEIISGK